MFCFLNRAGKLVKVAQVAWRVQMGIFLNRAKGSRRRLAALLLNGSLPAEADPGGRDRLIEPAKRRALLTWLSWRWSLRRPVSGHPSWRGTEICRGLFCSLWEKAGLRAAPTASPKRLEREGRVGLGLTLFFFFFCTQHHKRADVITRASGVS